VNDVDQLKQHLVWLQQTVVDEAIYDRKRSFGAFSRVNGYQFEDLL